MTTTLTEDQLALAEVTLDFAQEQLAPHAVAWDQDKHFPVDVIRRAASLGLAGVYVREEHGGSGLSRSDGVLVFETLATGCPSIAGYLSIHNMVAWMIDRYGDEGQRARWLPALCAAATLGSYCLTEPGAGSDAAALRTRAERRGDHYVLTGVKQFISGAGASDVYVVMARTGEPGAGGISAFVVERGDPGVSFGPNERKMGWNAQPTRQVILDGVRIPADRRLGVEGDGFRIAMNGLNGGRLGIGACSLGGAQSALDFLRPLARFDARDHFGGRAPTIRAGLDAFLARQGVTDAGGRVMMLAHARVFHHVFNPLTLYWCHDRAGRQVCVVAEVHNTYGGRHCYLLRPDANGRADAAKTFHVSPFFDVEGSYRMRLPLPGERLDLSVQLRHGDGSRPLTATVRGRRRAAGAPGLLAAALSHPWSTLAVTLGIRWHGVRLCLKGLPVRPRPVHPTREGML